MSVGKESGEQDDYLDRARQSERAPKSVPPESVVNSGVGCLYSEIRYP